MSELRWILLGCGVGLLLAIFLWGRRSRGQAAGDDVAVSRAPVARHEVAAGQEAAVDGVDEPAEPVASRWQQDEWTDTVADLPEIRAGLETDSAPPLLPDGDEVLLPADEDIETLPGLNTKREPAPAAPTRAAEPAAAPIRESSMPAAKAADRRKIIALRLSAVPPDRYPGRSLKAAFAACALTHGRYGIFHRLESGGSSVFSVASMVEPGAFDLATMEEASFAGLTIFMILPGPVPAAAACDALFAAARQLEEQLGGELLDERGVALSPERMADLRDDALDFEHLLGARASA